MNDRKRESRWTLALAVAVLAGLSVAAGADARQQRRPGQRTGELEETMRGQLQQAPGQFGATVSRVRVDVIVTDADGNFVDNLDATDFEVYEDGEPRQVLDVQLVDLPAGRVRALGQAESPAPPAPAGGAPANPQATPAERAPGERTPAEGVSADNAASALGAVIFLIDGPSLDQPARARFGDAWEKLLDQTDVPRVPRAAYLFDNYGRIEELAPLGTDLETIRSAAEEVRQAPFFGTSMRRRMFEIAGDLSNTYATRSADIARQNAAAKARVFEVEERNRSLATYELLTNLADALWSRSGRTAVVWVSTGVKLMQGGPFTALVAFDPRLTSAAEGDPTPVDQGLASARFDLNSPDARIKAAQERLHRAANASNVSFYTVDPSLLSRTRSIGGDVEVGVAAAGQLLSTSAVEASLDAMKDSMRAAASETGGRAFIQNTDITMALEEIERDTGRFYLISYEPPNVRGDGGYHEIRVDVRREGVGVRARGGYVDYPVEDRARRSVEVALVLPGLANELPVQTEAFRSRAPSGGPNLLSAVAVNGSELGVAVGSRGERQVSIDVHSVVFGSEGVVDQSHDQIAAHSAADGSFRPTSGDGAVPTLVGFLAHQHEWTLEPGPYTLNVAVRDNITGRVGAASIDIEIAGTAGEWGISDPLFATMDEAGRVQPVVLGRVLEGQSTSVFVEVYGGVQPVLTGRVFLRPEQGGNPEQGAQLFPTAMRPAGSGVHRGSLLLPPGMPPGGYFVQLQVTDEPARQDRVVRLPLEIVAPGQR